MADQNPPPADLRALAMLRAAPGNAVVYSEQAWAAARKGSSGGDDALWFPDSGAHRAEHLSAAEMVAWATDWQMMTALSYPPADDVREALIEHIQFGSVAPATADAILSDPRFEVRLRGTFTEAEEEVSRFEQIAGDLEAAREVHP